GSGQLLELRDQAGDARIPDAPALPLAALADEVEADRGGRGIEVLRPQGSHPVAAVLLGVARAPDAEELPVDEPHRAGGDAVAIQSAAAQIAIDGCPQRGQRGAETLEPRELAPILPASEGGMVDRLRAPGGVDSARLHLGPRGARDLDVVPRRRHRERIQALELGALRDPAPVQ